MESEEKMWVSRRAWVRTLVIGLVVAVLAPAAWAQAATSGVKIFTCIDPATGGKITRDRPIPECATRDQRQLNADGSLKRVIPPTLTAEERADAEALERESKTAQVAKQDAIRRDRNLTQRFPNDAAHKKAREGALDDVRNSVRLSEARVKLLMAERKYLTDEAEFYTGKALPAKLKASLDANDASLAAQRSLIQNQQVEVVRIDGLYDLELARLKKLWAGAPAGSLGPASAPK